MHIRCPGHPGHGSLLLENTAGEKVSYILNKFLEFRKEQQKKLKDDPSLTLGDVTTVNITQLQVSYTYIFVGILFLSLISIKIYFYIIIIYYIESLQIFNFDQVQKNIVRLENMRKKKKTFLCRIFYIRWCIRYTRTKEDLSDTF